MLPSLTSQIVYKSAYKPALFKPLKKENASGMRKKTNKPRVIEVNLGYVL